MKNKSLLDEPFDFVVSLYATKIAVEKNNDIRGRTWLLNKYPELFDQNILAEMADVLNIAKATITRLEARNKVIKVNFRRKS